MGSDDQGLPVEGLGLAIPKRTPPVDVARRGYVGGGFFVP